MGNTASSKAAISNTQEAYTEAIQSTINSSMSRAKNNTSIIVKNVKGDVNIGDITVAQRAEAFAKAQFTNSSSADILQKVAANLNASSSSLVEGIGLGNSSKSNTSINNYVNSTMKLSQKISNECGADASNTVNIEVSNVGGDVNVKNVNIEQDAKAILQCMNSNIQTIVATQISETTATATSAAVSKGLSGLGLLLLLLLPVILIVGLVLAGGAVAKFASNLLTPNVMGGLILLGIIIILASATSYCFENYSKTQIPELDSTCTDLFDTLEHYKKNPPSLIKAFLYTPGIWGNETSTEMQYEFKKDMNLFGTVSPTILSTPVPQEQLITQQALTQTELNIKGKTFEINKDLTNGSYNSVEKAFSEFKNNKECRAMDILYDYQTLQLRYIFYKTITESAIKTVNDYVKPDEKIHNRYLPPLICSVIPCHENLDRLNEFSRNNTNILFPYFIGITGQGLIYFWKNNRWNQVNESSFLGTRSAPPVTNFLVYLGNPDQIPSLIIENEPNIALNPNVDKTKSLVFIDVSANNGADFDIYWRESSTGANATPSTKTGFIRIETVKFQDLLRSRGLTWDVFSAFGPNPLTQLMNRTWVKFTNPNDTGESVLTKDERNAVRNGFMTSSEQTSKQTCESNVKIIDESKKRKSIWLWCGIALIATMCLSLLVYVIVYIVVVAKKCDVLTNPSKQKSNAVQINNPIKQAGQNTFQVNNPLFKPKSPVVQINNPILQAPKQAMI